MTRRYLVCGSLPNVAAIRVKGSAFGLVHSIARHATGSQRTHRAGPRGPRRRSRGRPRSQDHDPPRREAEKRRGLAASLAQRPAAVSSKGAGPGPVKTTAHGFPDSTR